MKTSEQEKYSTALLKEFPEGVGKVKVNESLGYILIPDVEGWLIDIYLKEILPKINKKQDELLVLLKMLKPEAKENREETQALLSENKQENPAKDINALAAIVDVFKLKLNYDL